MTPELDDKVFHKAKLNRGRLRRNMCTDAAEIEKALGLSIDADGESRQFGLKKKQNDIIVIHLPRVKNREKRRRYHGAVSYQGYN